MTRYSLSICAAIAILTASFRSPAVATRQHVSASIPPIRHTPLSSWAMSSAHLDTPPHPARWSAHGATHRATTAVRASFRASSLKWFPNTPDNGFQIGKGDEFQLAVLGPNDNDPAIRRVVFFAKWPNRPWGKVRCDGPNQGPTRTRPWARISGDANDTLYTCDVIDTVTDAGQVQFSFDVDGPDSHVTTHPDGIRTGQNHAYHDCYTSACAPSTGGLLGPHDFQRAYSVHGGAEGVDVGIIMGGIPLSPADLAVFAFNTNTRNHMLRTGTHGPDTVEWHFIGSIAKHRGADSLTKLELAMDVEYAHAMAPGSHLVVWLLPIAKDGGPNSAYVSLAIRKATNSEARIVSNSWHVLNPSCPGATLPDGSLSNAYNHQAEALALAEQKGKTFFVDSGDSGEDSGCSSDASQSTPPAEAAFPAMSPHVVAVGGTSFIPGKGEFAWGATSASTGYTFSSGGGCAYRPDLGIVRPKWQTDIHPDPKRCDRRARAVPDVAADADPSYPGAYVVYTDGGTQHIEGNGGTSLATPLWAGMAADLQHYLEARHKKLNEFMGPGLYALATNPVTGPRDFHDITAWGPNEDKGNGFRVGTGWDEVTGWGSPDLDHLEEDWASTDGGRHFPPSMLPHGTSLRVGLRVGQPGDHMDTIDGDGFPSNSPITLTLCAGVSPTCTIGVPLRPSTPVETDGRGSFSARDALIPLDAANLPGADSFVRAATPRRRAPSTDVERAEVDAYAEADARFTLHRPGGSCASAATPSLHTCPFGWTTNKVVYLATCCKALFPHVYTIMGYDPATGAFTGTGIALKEGGFAETLNGTMSPSGALRWHVLYTGANAGYTYDLTAQRQADGSFVGAFVDSLGDRGPVTFWPMTGATPDPLGWGTNAFVWSSACVAVCSGNYTHFYFIDHFDPATGAFSGIATARNGSGYVEQIHGTISREGLLRWHLLYTGINPGYEGDVTAYRLPDGTFIGTILASGGHKGVGIVSPLWREISSFSP